MIHCPSAPPEPPHRDESALLLPPPPAPLPPSSLPRASFSFTQGENNKAFGVGMSWDGRCPGNEDSTLLKFEICIELDQNE